MIDLDTIFDNIDEYSNNIDDLTKALRQVGINNFDDFKNAAREAGIPIKKSIQDQLVIKFSTSEEDDWQEAKSKNTIEAYQYYLDSYPDGNYRREARDLIEDLQKVLECAISEEIWNHIDKSSIAELQNFIAKYPNSTFSTEATRFIRELRKEQSLGVGIKALVKQIKAIRTDVNIYNPEKAIYDKIVNYISTNKITVENLLEAIKEDNNLISGTVANLLYDNGIISDFSQAEIDEEFITHMIQNKTPEKFQPVEPITKITKSPCTEVYFWGIPSSGKTCAVGAILSSANSGKVARSMLRDNNCQGYGYMNRLANLFKTKGEVGTLPEGTAISSTYEMGFVLEDKERKEHPITCIDLAGELVRCMYKYDAGEPLTIEQQSVLETLTNVLIDNRTDNRKIHFFVIEYGAEDREYEGLPQNVYLDAAVAYIQRTGIFKKDTDGLYLLITKVDKAKVKGKELEDKLRSYISENYHGFYNGLEKICRDNEINGGKVEIIPFTLGKVCFQNYCKFQEDTAAFVVEKLIKKSYGYKPGKVWNLLNRLKK